MSGINNPFQIVVPLVLTDTAANIDLILQNTTPATASSVGNAPVQEFIATYWNGAASAQVNLTSALTVATGTNGAVTVAFTTSGSTGGTNFIFNDQSVSTANSQISLQAGGATKIDLRYNANGTASYLEFGASTINQIIFPASVTTAVNTGIVSLNGDSSTSSTRIFVSIGACLNSQSFHPTSGNAKYVCLNVNPTINQTSTANGVYTALQVNVTETSYLGSASGALLADYQVGGVSKASIDRTGNYYYGVSKGVSAGSFSSVTAISASGGLVTQLTGTSDIRLKTWTGYEKGLDVVLNINPIYYHWNDKGRVHTGLSSEQEYIGFSAQNIQEVIPQAITATEMSKDGTEEYLSLDDRPIIAALVNAVKELSARVDRIETWFNGAQIIKC